ncbi:heavy metal-binding domain-containing protein [Acidimicrobiaceae bacterium USS-CC1]|uniref:Heavy metal-binding domain-containing protein n=1 Tax=Acidiferrimicrobium australe TaxID=2664430 RepID=A0ABW9QU07_9ACTN|nr:heavy metal-binding domain-containing protein [Acidiferrimicrobium australe]
MTDGAGGAATGGIFADRAHREADLGQIGRLLAESHGAPGTGQGCTSSLSLDEVLLLHAVGLEPAAVVTATACTTIPTGSWTWSQGQVQAADYAFSRAFLMTRNQLRAEAARIGAVGVVAVDIELQLAPHRYLVVMLGTAVRAASDEHGQSRFPVRYPTPFLCDLSARDFVVLSRAGWYPIDLVGGASFVHAPRRGMGAALGQVGQNVELTNFTETLYAARELAMERIQQDIREVGGTGLLDMRFVDRPVPFAGHVVRFTAYGTAVKLLADTHSHPELEMVVPLDDRTVRFEASSLD